MHTTVEGIGGLRSRRNVTMTGQKDDRWSISICQTSLQFQASHIWKLEVKNEDICLNLDRLDGILIEMVVEEREPGIPL
jgi:hypothetical protein